MLNQGNNVLKVLLLVNQEAKTGSTFLKKTTIEPIKKMIMKKILTILTLAIGSQLCAQTLSPTADLTTARWKHQAELLENGNLMVFGGDDGIFLDPEYLKSCELYNPGTETWSATGDMNTRRNNFASAVITDGKVLAIGGKTTGESSLATCEVYNPGTGTWSYVSEMNASRWGHNAVKLLDGRILVVGGDDEDVPTAEIYDPILDTWTMTGELMYEHGQYSSLVLLDDGRALCTGGWYADPDGFIAQIYDPETDEWEAIVNMDFERQSHSSVLLNDGKVLIYGYFTPNQAEIFDPITNTFTPTGATQTGKTGSEGIRLSDGRVLTFAIGDVFSPGDTKSLEIYNPISGTWSAPVTGIIGVNYHTMDALNTGEILIAGGNINTGSGASAWCWTISGVVAADVSQEEELVSFNLYPNPSSEQLTIELSNPEFDETTIQIINSAGIVIRSIKSISDLNQIDIHDLDAGFYFVRILDQKNVPQVRGFVKI